MANGYPPAPVKVHSVTKIELLNVNVAVWMLKASFPPETDRRMQDATVIELKSLKTSDCS